jgi:acetoin utilization deacetylase AcuC-like enzyme
MMDVFYSKKYWQIEPAQDKSGRVRYWFDATLKCRWIAERLKNYDDVRLIEPKPLEWKDFSLVHRKNYINLIRYGRQKDKFNYSWIFWGPKFARSQLYVHGGIYVAANAALKMGVSGSLSSGVHHALSDKGAGFCTFNGVAVAIRKLQKNGAIKKAFILDLDAHYGDGTARIFKNDRDVFIYDLFGLFHRRSLPLLKNRENRYSRQVKNSKDYFNELENLEGIISKFKPQIIFYISGVDCDPKDRYGGIKGMGKKMIAKRENLVFKIAKKLEIPIVFNTEGGYVAYRRKDGVLVSKDEKERKRKKLIDLHFLTIEAALNIT